MVRINVIDIELRGKGSSEDIDMTEEQREEERFNKEKYTGELLKNKRQGRGKK